MPNLPKLGLLSDFSRSMLLIHFLNLEVKKGLPLIKGIFLFPHE